MWGTFEKRLIVGAVALAWLSWMVLQCVWQMWGHGPAPPEASPRAHPLPMHRARHVLEPFSTNVVANFVPAKDVHNPFYPNPTQPLPAPPPASTRQVTLVYQGHYATSQGDKHAYVLAGTNLVTGPVGTSIIAGFAIAEIAPQQLTLSDSSGKRITLEFTVPKTIDIPL
jgi:hypothetical protein